MFTQSRRLALKLLGLGSALFGMRRSSFAAQQTSSISTTSTVGWSRTHDRVWLSGDCWANPMEDWRIVDGAAECQSTGGNRSVHLITHQLTNASGEFNLSVAIDQIEAGEKDGGAGFRIGIHSELNEYRSNCFTAGGINAGFVDGRLMIGPKNQPVNTGESTKHCVLKLAGRLSGDECELTLTVENAAGKTIGRLVERVPVASVLGNIAIVNNFEATGNGGSKKKKGTPSGNVGSRHRFRDWTVSGNAFTISPEHAFGPILWSMYSLSDSRSADGFVLKISALTGPLGAKDSKAVELQIEEAGKWRSLGESHLDTDAWTATFRIPKWNEKIATRYKLVYREQHRDRSQTVHEWSGTIKPNPTGRPLRIGAMTCQNDMGFPYEPVANNLVKLDPDLLYFSGDQIYESHGGFGIIRDPAEPAILNYLRKFYQFGWAFREAMRDRPTLCIPDDHDVFQGNIWGDGGKKMADNNADSQGGYREPARMVNVVHKTNASHHPDYYDARPVEQGISVYYGDMVYGGVGFAIIGDRQFKSGPENVNTGSGRADHVEDPDFDTNVLDKPGLVLLGERQEKFLEHWADDWRGHTMKVLLSQTVFAGVATHHGNYNGYLKADLDCGGWPQTARNNAIRILRKAKPLHINGDQHLASIVQYGVDRQRDSFWSFCTPAIAVGYPRWWRPDELGVQPLNRPSHGLSDTGEYSDGLGNKMFVQAIGNPEKASLKHRYELAHQKGSGFGLVTIDTAEKTYKLEAFRFLCDATDGKASNQFPGWPFTVHQEENAGMK